MACNEAEGLSLKLEIKIKSEGGGPLGRMGRIVGRFGTDVGTDKTCKIVNVYRPWDGGTDKLGGRSREQGAGRVSGGGEGLLHAPGSRLLASRASRVGTGRVTGGV